MHSASNRALLPISCRFVPYDQWFLTHLDDRWRVKQVKHWILTKCNLVHSPDTSTHRPVSPITFASSIRSRRSIDSSDDGYNEDDEYDDDSEDNLPPRYGSASDRDLYSHLAAKSRPFPGTVQPGSSPLADQYTLTSFSTGTILEDDFTLSWYSLRPFELLELHPVGTIIPLPRDILADYIQPYFQAKVRAFRAVWSPRSGRFEVPGHDSQHELNTQRGQDKFGPLLDAFSPKQGSLHHDKRRKAKLEWKDRWVVIHQGVLSLCKGHATNPPIHQFSLPTMKALRGTDTLERTFSIATEPRVVCIKFRTINPEPASGVFSPPPSTPSSPILEHWKNNINHDRKDRSSLHAEGSPSKTKHDSERERLRKGPDKYKFDSDDVCTGEGEWLVLDMLDDHAFSSMLRVLHRYFPSPISSSFLPSSSVVTVAGTSGFSPSDSSPYDTIPYPEWRLNTVENARKAGMGDVGKPMAWVLWTEKGLGETLIGNIRQHRHAFSQEMQYKTIAIPSYAYSDLEEDSEEDSEIEWEGWMRDLDRQGRIKQQPENATRHSTSRQLRTHQIHSNVLSPLPSPPLSDASSGSPRGCSPLSLHSATSSLSGHPHTQFPNINDVIQNTTGPGSYVSQDLPRSLERIRTTTVSTVSVGPPRRRSSTVSSETTSKHNRDKGKRVEELSSPVLSNGTRVNPKVIRTSPSLRRAPKASLRHAHSSSNLTISQSYASDTADSSSHPAPSSSPKHQNTFIRGMSLRADKIVRGLDSAIDFVDETG